MKIEIASQRNIVHKPVHPESEFCILMIYHYFVFMRCVMFNIYVLFQTILILFYIHVIIDTRLTNKPIQAGSMVFACFT